MIFKKANKNPQAFKKSEFEYQVFPRELKVRILHSWSDANRFNQYWEQVVAGYIRKKGLFRIGPHDYELDNVTIYLLNADVATSLDFVEYVYSELEKSVAGLPTYEETDGRSGVSYASWNIKEMLAELNGMFSEYNMGYQYLNGKIIRRDEEFMHNQVVEPAMKFLLDKKFDGAAAEFSNAHDHYKSGRMKESITESNKAFESTMKSICDIRNWSYSRNAQAKELIDVLVKNNLISTEQLSHFSSLRSLLESGIPTLRNKRSAHGQGINVTSVPSYIAKYALNLAASNILFLIDANDELK